MTEKNIACLILASGLGTRFGRQDKLMALLDGQPVLAHTAKVAMGVGFSQCIAVVPQDHLARQDLLNSLGVELVMNPSPELGQGGSLALGAKTLRTRLIDGVIVLLADMPFIRVSDLQEILSNIRDQKAMICEADGQRTPPVYFARSCFEALSQLKGDDGGKSVLSTLAHVDILPLQSEAARDIDHQTDLHLIGGAM